MHKYVLVVTGPTAVGKTACCMKLAEYFNTEIISADARQCYQGMAIGTAQPSATQRQQIKHHFIDCLPLEAPMNACLFGEMAAELLQDLFRRHDYVVVTGGSGLYLQALVDGLDAMPTVSPEIRSYWQQRWQLEGLPALVAILAKMDPVYHAVVDKHNPRRILRALEVCTAGPKPYSQFRNELSQPEHRPFRVLTMGLCLDRPGLYERIDQRVDQMVASGLLSEAQSLYPYRHYQALQTVGYRELFEFFEQQCTLEAAVGRIKQHTRRYAKRQLTWFNKQDGIQWFAPSDWSAIVDYVHQRTVS